MTNKDETMTEEMSSSDIDLETVYDIPVEISVVLGRAKMPINQLLKLGKGAVVELDHSVGEAIDVLVNGRLVAKGEVVIVENKIGVTLTELVKSQTSSK